MVKELNWLYRREPALYEVDDSYHGFEWIDLQDAESSIITFIRFARNREDFIVFACNFTPVPREGYRIGVPRSRTLSRTVQHRLRAIRRREPGQCRRGDGGRNSSPRASRQHQRDHPAAGGGGVKP